MSVTSSSSLRSRLLLEPPLKPRLRPSSELAQLPVEQSSMERVLASQTWQVLRSPEEMLADRSELERLDRAIVTVRKQTLATRAENDRLLAQLTQVTSERYEAPVVWGLGALAAVSLLAWVQQRRELVARDKRALDTADAGQVSQQPPASRMPPRSKAMEPTGDSAFPGSDLSLYGDEGDQWIGRSRNAIGEPH